LKGRRFILVAACALPGLACAPVPGEGMFVQIAAEEAIIIWDEGAKRQHFIRRASFDTDAKDFGLLVPTPSKPELGESDDAAFDLLAKITAPTSAPVTLLEQKPVAGLDAAVLEASDAKALDGWLSKHGYPSSPQLVEWYAPYVAAQWKITAFRIAADSPKVSSAAVRMSFQTERPFFPYREPAARAGATAPARLLRVYFVSEGRVDGAIGREAYWPGKPVWSREIEPGQLARLLKVAGLPVMAGGGGRWLTKFEDRSSPRAGADEVFFARTADQSPLAQQPLAAPSNGRTYALAAAVGLLVVIAILATAYVRRRRRTRRLFG
jgi:hypothetical protein